MTFSFTLLTHIKNAALATHTRATANNVAKLDEAISNLVDHHEKLKAIGYSTAGDRLLLKIGQRQVKAILLRQYDDCTIVYTGLPGKLRKALLTSMKANKLELPLKRLIGMYFSCFDSHRLAHYSDAILALGDTLIKLDYINLNNKPLLVHGSEQVSLIKVIK